MKKLIAMLSSLCMLISVAYTPAFAAGFDFIDVPTTHWAYQSIESAADKGWVNGVGNGRYNPDGSVTGAEWMTMLTRAFFNSNNEVGEVQPGEVWYQPYLDVAEFFRLVDKDWSSVQSNLTNPISRYDMATLIYNTINNMTGIGGKADPSEIGDWNQIPAKYQDAVAVSYEAGILVGNNSDGDFCGDENMTRAQAAVVLMRLDEYIYGDEPVQPDEPEIPETPETPEEPETPTTTSGAVGTLSSTPVTLSYETHKPVVDYWSDAPADIQAITDQEVYNCAVQTLKDQDIIRDPDVMEGNINPYYNYAVYHTELTDKENIVTTAISNMSGAYNGFGTTTVSRNGDGTFDKAIIAGGPFDETGKKYAAVIDPILDTLNDSMSDKEKAEVMVKAICDRFVYKAGDTFRWPDPVGSTGDCENYMHAVNDIFNAAGIPVFTAMGHNHGWNYAYLDGSWYVIDATNGESGSMDYAIVPENEYFAWQGWNDPYSETNETTQVAMALIESALNA